VSFMAVLTAGASAGARGLDGDGLLTAVFMVTPSR
jgi:hypothetical protein